MSRPQVTPVPTMSRSRITLAPFEDECAGTSCSVATTFTLIDTGDNLIEASLVLQVQGDLDGSNEDVTLLVNGENRLECADTPGFAQCGGVFETCAVVNVLANLIDNDGTLALIADSSGAVNSFCGNPNFALKVRFTLTITCNGIATPDGCAGPTSQPTAMPTATPTITFVRRSSVAESFFS